MNAPIYKIHWLKGIMHLRFKPASELKSKFKKVEKNRLERPYDAV